VPRQGSRRRGGVLDWRFFFEVVLQDDTGTLRAVVADEVGTHAHHIIHLDPSDPREKGQQGLAEPAGLACKPSSRI
jgi:hypothetical protein